MRLLRCLPLCAVVATAAWPAHAAEQARVTLLHTTDLHGALTSWDYARDRAADRGLTRIASLVRAARAEGDPTLLLDAGDATEGGIETAYHMGPERRPDPMIAAMNALGYDAMTVGNHEFDSGWTALEGSRKAARFPWLAANVMSADSHRALFVPSIIKQAGPVKIGVIGICTPAVPRFLDPNSVAGLRFENPVTVARDEADRLRRIEHCDAVVLVAHTGLERDPRTGIERHGDTPNENWGVRLAKQVPGIDVLILGHTHTVVPSADIQNVLVTQAGKSGECLGRVDLQFTRGAAGERWRLTSRHARVLPVSRDVAADPAIAALAAPYHDEARGLLARSVGSALRDLAAPRGRLGNGPTWELIHRAQLEATGADVSLSALPDPSAVIAAGPITYSDLIRLYPYGNTLSVVELTGADLRAVLEQSAHTFARYTFDAGAALVDSTTPGYNFDTAYGVDYAIDLTRPPGQRIVGLEFQGRPVLPAQRFKVAVNSYRMNGGGGFETIRRARRLRVGVLTVRDAIAALLRRSGPVEGTSRSNWTLLPDYALHIERPLIDVLVRQGALTAEQAKRLRPDDTASPREIDQWIARAFGFSVGAAAMPDARGYATAAGTGGMTLTEPTREAVAQACLEAAQRAGFEGLSSGGAEAAASFRRALVGGTSLAAAERLAPASDGRAGTPVTRAQALGMVANARYPTIRVLETTDFHGAILAGQTERRTNRQMGSSAALSAAIQRLRAENPEGTVLIDGGDLFQGTMISNLQFGRPVVEQMNILGYAATAVGNHEFDWTVDTLVSRVHEMKFAALGANMRERKTGNMPDWVRSDTTVTRRGARVSVLGLCYRFTPTVTLSKNVAELQFLDDSTVAAALVPKLRPSCDALIGVGHIPAESDSVRKMRGGDLPRLAGVRGVDAWFGGHSHNLVLDQVNGIPFAIAGSQGVAVAVCDLVVDPAKHQVVERHCDLQLVYTDEGVDSLMQQRVERWNAAVAPIAGMKLGTNAHRLTRNRGGESTVGDLVCDAILEASGADIAMQNSGGLRADLAEGPVTKASVFEVIPFDNTVYLLDLTGAEVKLALEQGLRGGRVTQVGGIRYTFDPDAPAMRRLQSVTLADGRPVDDAKLYRVAVNDFMATGGDEYAVLSRGKNRTPLDLRVRDVLEQRVVKLAQQGKPVDYQPSGRIERLTATAPAPAGNK